MKEFSFLQDNFHNKGFPNVGKSSFMNQVTNANVEVQVRKERDGLL